MKTISTEKLAQQVLKGDRSAFPKLRAALRDIAAEQPLPEEVHATFDGAVDDITTSCLLGYSDILVEDRANAFPFMGYFKGWLDAHVAIHLSLWARTQEVLNVMPPGTDNTPTTARSHARR